MLGAIQVLCLSLWWAGPVFGAINVTFEKIARTGDSVPGRETLNVVFNGRAFQRFGPGVFSRPSINDAGQVVFMARSTCPNDFNCLSTIGIYLKSPSSPLQLIVDQSLDGFGNVPSVGAPFAVPGRPADARFTNFPTAPLINNRGDVLFVATFFSFSENVSGTGFYVFRAADLQIVKIVDTLDQVPGFPGQTFNAGFTFFRDERLLASLNDQGQVVFTGRFRRPGEQFEDQGYYGASIDGAPVSGGPLVRLADSTDTVIPNNETIPFRGVSNNQPAISNTGAVIFQASIGSVSPSTFLNGVFTVPVDASTGASTIARRGQVSPPLSDGIARAYFSVFGGQDINDAGDFTFHHSFSGNPRPNAILTGNVASLTDPLGVVVDTLGGFTVPGQPSGTDFTGMAIAAINEAGEMGFFTRDDGPVSNAQGIYAADLAASPFGKVAHNGDIPPGQVAPASISDFKGQSAAINDLGNMALAPSAVNKELNDSLFGLYFYDSCTGILERVVDRNTSSPVPPVGVGDAFVAPGCAGFPCERAVRIFDGFETRSGHYRSINNQDDIGFLVAFSTFNVAVYIAHVQTSGGQLAITCPADVTLECPAADTGPDATGTPGVCSEQPATVTFNDAGVPGCGNTQTITRTWTADHGTGTVSCDQVISVVDTTGPELLGVPDDANVDCNALPPPASPTTTDACDSSPIITLQETETPLTCGGAFMITRTWTATDACGNSTTRCQILIVANTSAPVLTVPANVTVECGGDTSPATTGQAGATADCQGTATVTFGDSTAPGPCGAASVITRTWTATDNCGNAASADQMITVSDTTGPLLTLPLDVTLECDADSSPSGAGTATATDGCGGTTTVSFTDEVTTNDICGAGSVITRTWTATDECSNSTNADQLITVRDTIAPTINVDTTPITVVDADCSGAEAVTLPTATATDNCDENVMVSNDAPATFPAGVTTTVTFTATDGCGQSDQASVDVSVDFGANIEVHADKHTVASGSHPGSTKEPLVGIEVCAYDKSAGSCVLDTCGGVSHQNYQCIVDTCTPVGCAMTDAQGVAVINLPPGDYIVISEDATKTVLPDPLGVSASNLVCGELKKKHLQQIVKANGKIVPGKTTRLTGSELLIIEPEFVIWDGVDQLYPFVFETIGDWGVTASVTPPVGFVADYNELAEIVDNEIEAVQFTITEVGSDLVPTQTTFEIMHKGQPTTVRSQVGIYLTEDYAKSRGFNVATLRANGLIKERPTVSAKAISPQGLQPIGE